MLQRLARNPSTPETERRFYTTPTRRSSGRSASGAPLDLIVCAMNKKIYVILILLLAGRSSAETPWEAYLALPTPRNASQVTKIQYGPGAIPENYRYWAPDLKILANQILGGDSESFRLAFRLRRDSDGGLLEELTMILSHTIRPHPEFFLRQLLELKPSKTDLEDILLMSGLEYVDRPRAQQYEIEMRRKALASVKTMALRGLRDKCLSIIKQE